MAITVDQTTLGTNGNIGGATSLTFNTSAAVAAGGYVVVGTGWSGAFTATSATVGGNAATIIKQGATGSDSVALVGFYAAAGLASATTITVNLSGTAIDRTIGAMSFLGVDPVTPISSTTGPTVLATAAWATAAATLAAGGAMVGLLFREGFAPASNTPAAGVTESYDVSTDDNDNVLAYRIEAAGGSFTVGGTTDSAQASVNVGAVLAPAGGGSTDLAAPWLLRPPGRIAPSSRIWVPFPGVSDAPVVNDFFGDSTIAETDTVVATGTALGDVAIAETVTITAVGSVNLSGSLTAIAETDTITAIGTATGSVTIAETDTITAVGSTNLTGTSAISETDTITVVGGVIRTGGVAISETDTITVVGAVAVPAGSVTINETITVTAAGGGTGSSTISETVTITAAGVVNKFAGSTISETDTISVTGAATGSVTRTETVTITAAGNVATSSGVTISETVTISTSGSGPNAVNIVETATVSVSGAVNKTGGSTISLTATITASGNVATSSGSAVSETVTVSVTGRATGTVTIGETDTITAVGSVVFTGTVAITEVITIVADGVVVTNVHTVANSRRLFVARHQPRTRTVAPENRYPLVPPDNRRSEA